MRKLHWFWRAAIASATAWLSLSLSLLFLRNPLSDAMRAIEESVGESGRTGEAVSVPVVIVLPTVVIAFGVFGLLTRHFAPPGIADGETRCRKCGYILRGITEPRCPECGERI